MRIAYITAGAAGSYCGTCTRDVALARGLIALGHDVHLVPLYTPIRTDLDGPGLERVFYGGLNVYLAQAWSGFGRAPAIVRRLLDRPGLLRLASRFAIRTRPAELGAMTVSVLEGADGRQRRELDELLDYLSGERPDVVNLTNSMLAGMAGPLRDRLGVPVVCTLQGEEHFLRGLARGHAERAVEVLRRKAADVAAFVAPGEGYADEMAGFLGVSRERVHVVRLGIETERYARASARQRDPFVVGYLGRMAHSKGLDLVCDAFRSLGQGTGLLLAGRAAGPDAELWQDIRAGLERDGLGACVQYMGEPDLAGKVRMMHCCSAFCLPSRFPEPRGTVCLEAMAAGVPVVVPDLGIFPEIVRLTGGGMLVPPGDAGAAAAALQQLRDDPERADALGMAGARGVAEHFGAERMARETAALYRRLTGVP